MMKKRTLLSVPLLLALCQCSALPVAGPSRQEVSDQSVAPANAPTEALSFELVDLSADVIAQLQRRPTESFFSSFGDRRPPPPSTIGVGDQLNVAIYEAAAGGLFSSAGTDLASGSHSATLPPQVVGRSGTVKVPYAGVISVVGKTTDEAAAAIEHGLLEKAIQPQVVVSIVKNVAASVTVSGEVSGAGRIPLTPRGDRLLDVIATAGGIRAPESEIFVKLTRGGVTHVMPMKVLIDRPQEDIFAQPGDILTIVRRKDTFTAFGATGRDATIDFDSDGLSLAQALGRAGGLLDERADPSGVFIFRYEYPEIVRAIHPASQRAGWKTRVPVIYRVDMRNAGSIFLAKAFRMSDQDVLYVSNSSATELAKVLMLFQAVTAPSQAIASVKAVGN